MLSRVVLAAIMCSACAQPKSEPPRAERAAAPAATPATAAAAVPSPSSTATSTATGRASVADATPAPAPLPTAGLVPAKPEWIEAPFDGLPERAAGGREVTVIFEVVSQYRRELEGRSSPLRLRIPESGVTQEIFDDRVVRPACDDKQDRGRGALLVRCNGIDGSVTVRAHQQGDELVLDVHGVGDAPPSLRGPQHRFKLPHGTRVRYTTSLPATRTRNPGSGESGGRAP